MFIYDIFQRFLNDRRDKCKTDNPTMPFSEITKQLAAAWNVLPASEKQVCHNFHFSKLCIIAQFHEQKFIIAAIFGCCRKR